MNYRVFTSSSEDLFWNLAAEDLLLSRQPAFGPALLLWRNQPAVVIGKNQNPWRECQPARLAAAGISLARRMSGGGAVYQDSGTLNLSFVQPRERYSREALFARLIAVLQRVGIRSERLHRTGLAVDGKKFSGNAFSFRGRGALHHGTLLIRTDLVVLQNALIAASWPIATRATESIRSPVTNLRSIQPVLREETLCEVLTEAFGDGSEPRDIREHLDAGWVERRSREFRSATWIYGKTPPFTVTLPAPGRAAGPTWTVSVKHGVITRIDADAGIEGKVGWEGRPFFELAARVRKDQAG